MYSIFYSLSIIRTAIKKVEKILKKSPRDGVLCAYCLNQLEVDRIYRDKHGFCLAFGSGLSSRTDTLLNSKSDLIVEIRIIGAECYC